MIIFKSQSCSYVENCACRLLGMTSAKVKRHQRMRGTGVGERRWCLFLGGDNEGYGNQLVKKNLRLKLTALTRLYTWDEELTSQV